MYFLDDNHRQNYTAMQLRVKKCKMDNSYLVAAYILSLPELQSKGASRYLSDDGFNWMDLLEKVDLSSGYGHLVNLAINLFTCGMGEFNLAEANSCLDSDMFNVMIQAILLYRGN